MQTKLPTTFDEYFAQFPENTKKLLEEIRALVKNLAPEATEVFSYAIPTFDLKGKHLIHFAGYKAHIGIYPTAKGVSNFEEELKPYKTSTGTIKLPLDKPLPLALIKKIVLFRVGELK